MYATVTQPLTCEDFLAWGDRSGTAFDLIDGVPVPLSEPNANYEDLIERLCAYIENQRMKTTSSSAAAYIPPPRVIEVVSNNWKDDYLTTVAQYEDLGVLKYIMIDYAAFSGIRFIGSPKQPTITIYQLEDRAYLPAKFFQGQDRIESRLFP